MTMIPVFAGLLIAFLIAAALMWRRITGNVRSLSESELALSEALDAADTANVVKSRFLANMSHELCTPLNGVLGLSEIVLMSGLTGAAARAGQRDQAVRRSSAKHDRANSGDGSHR